MTIKYNPASGYSSDALGRYVTSTGAVLCWDCCHEYHLNACTNVMCTCIKSTKLPAKYR